MHVILKIFQNEVIYISRNENDEIIIDTGLLNYLNYRTQLFWKLFLTQLTRIVIWNIINFIENYRHVIGKNNLWNYLPFIHICII